MLEEFLNLPFVSGKSINQTVNDIEFIWNTAGIKKYLHKILRRYRLEYVIYILPEQDYYIIFCLCLSIFKVTNMIKTNITKYDYFKTYYWHYATLIGQHRMPLLKPTQFIPQNVISFSE